LEIEIDAKDDHKDIALLSYIDEVMRIDGRSERCVRWVGNAIQLWKLFGWVLNTKGVLPNLIEFPRYQLLGNLTK
jgi:hypothetical protein